MGSPSSRVNFARVRSSHRPEPGGLGRRAAGVARPPLQLSCEVRARRSDLGVLYTIYFLCACVQGRKKRGVGVTIHDVRLPLVSRMFGFVDYPLTHAFRPKCLLYPLSQAR